jgi:hypothetical protein
VLRGRGAKRGELRGAARARAGRGGPPQGGVQTECLVGTPPCAWQLTLLSVSHDDNSSDVSREQLHRHVGAVVVVCDIDSGQTVLQLLVGSHCLL